MPSKRINLDEWYTNDQAVQRLSENSGHPVNRNYPRSLARHNKITSFDIGTGSKLYLKADVDAYVVDTKRGPKVRT